MNTAEDRRRMLGDMPVGQLLMRFSVPAIIGMIVSALYNVVDRIFLGMVSGQAIGAVYITFPIILVIMALSMLVGIGATTLISIRLGEDNHQEAERILGNAFIIMMVMSLVISLVILLFADPLLRVFGATPSLLPLAALYMRIVCLALPLQMVSFSLNSVIRAEGNPTLAMVTMMVGTLVNVVLDYLFIVQLGWGVAGAAWATVAGMAVSGLWILFYFLTGRSLLKLRAGYFRLDLALVRRIMALGIPSFGMQLANSLVITVINYELKIYGGDNALAAMGIIHSVSTLCFFPLFGINQGVQPIIGFNFGARQLHRVREALFKAIGAGTCFALASFILIMVFTDDIVRVFASNPETLAAIGDYTRQGLRINILFLPILGLGIVGGTYFQATGRAAIATFLSLTRQLIILVPCVVIFARLWGVTGVWMGYPASDLASTILVTYFLFRYRHELRGQPRQ
ncbi:MATE family efflux transporter [Peptococcus simiae]|uniref:MATE family efflux transporter n=1 Tax=Peptococcus simiae TaxID=1643805 RepID=UPI003980C5C8